MNPSEKKLRLNRVTLRDLTASDARGARGGRTHPVMSGTCDQSIDDCTNTCNGPTYCECQTWDPCYDTNTCYPTCGPTCQTCTCTALSMCC